MGENRRSASNRSQAEPGALRCALRALRQELLGFRFSYPLEIDEDAGPRDSLHYYTYSNALAWNALRLDSEGIPMAWYRSTGAAYWPAYIAWYGLVHLGHYLRNARRQDLDVFMRQVTWLEKSVTVREDGAAVWTMNFDYDVGTTRLSNPWISAHAQGLVISALIRGWRLTRSWQLYELLARSTRVFELDVEDGGLRITTGRGVLYTEVPGGPPPGILDGFLTSLLALYDTWIEFESMDAKELLDQGLDGLESHLPCWDFQGRWSWYGCREYLSTPAYHHQNRILLDILGRLADRPLLSTYANAWNLQNHTSFDRVLVFTAFTLTKNASRFRHKTWREGH